MLEKVTMNFIVSAFFVLGTLIGSSYSAARYDASILKIYEKSAVANFILHFHDSNVSAIIKEYHESYSPLQRSLDYDTLPKRLHHHAEESQAQVLDYLRGKVQEKSSNGVEFTQIWLLNQISVKSGNAALFRELLSMPEISFIEEDKEHKPDLGRAGSRNESFTQAKQSGNQWGVDDIGSPQVWRSGYTGRGVVVGVMDTGVRRSHVVLRENYRANYGWYDPINRNLQPYDDHGHGTHCAGTAVGKYGYGVAPDAQWIACKNIAGNGVLTFSNARICGQWMFCPTDASGNNENCAMRPKVVSNSWYFFENTNGYNDILDAWRSANMIFLFCNGNDGPNCNTLKSPADYGWSIAVGATTIENQMAAFSSRGPASTGRIKPDTSAPGKDIISASHKADDQYLPMSGTSMATPHVAGLAALIVQKYPNLNQENIWYRVTEKQRVKAVQASGQTCGGRSDNSYPNNAAGYGKVWAPAAIQ